MTDALDRLNIDIVDAELKLLKAKTMLNEDKKQHEINKLIFKNNLDKKEYSNEDKREYAASLEPNIKANQQSLADREYQIAVDQIELEAKHRMFKILLQMGAK